MPARRTLHVPMSAELYDKLQNHARQMGFDSAQAYIRFWATAETDGQKLTIGRYNFPDLTSTKAQALRYMELLLALHQENFPSMEHAILWLARQIRHDNLHRYLKSLLSVDRRVKW
jgi:hypothetical protein